MRADPSLTTGTVLRLLGGGAGGAILVALGNGPLRTKQLTEHVSSYAPRTVYRYAARLAQVRIVSRDEEMGVPSKVEYSLTEPCGRELFSLIDAFADVSLTRLPNGEIDAHAWGSLGLLADLWESGMVEALNLGPRTLTELSRVGHGLSYHQVSRRAGMFAIGGFLQEDMVYGRRRGYTLTEKARRGMALIAGIGRWRRRYVVPEGTTGLTPREVGGVLRTALPLVALPEHAGKGFGIEIAAEAHAGGGSDTVWARVGDDGAVSSSAEPVEEIADRAHGKVTTLVDAILDGPGGDLTANGDGHLVKTCLERLHTTLWSAWPPSPAPAEAVAGRGNGA